MRASSSRTSRVGQRRRRRALLRVRGVGQQQVDAAVTQPGQRRQIASQPSDRAVLDAEVPGVHDRAARAGERHRRAVRGAVGERHELHLEGADRDRAAEGHLDQLGAVQQPVLLELRAHQRQRESPAVDRHLADRAQQEGDGADVVLVAVGEDHGLQPVAPLHHVAEVGQHDVHAHLVVLGEGDAAVHDHHPVVVLDHVHVLADLAGAAERDHADAAAGGRSQFVLLNRCGRQARDRMPCRSSTVRRISRCTGVASIRGRRSRPDGMRPVISSAALMRMGLVVTKSPA